MRSIGPKAAAFSRPHCLGGRGPLARSEEYAGGPPALPGQCRATISRERLFTPAERWQQTRRAQYRRLALPTEAGAFLAPLLEPSQHAIARVADAAVAGELRVDDELHLTPLAAEVRFSWIMLGREPRSDKELLMVYAGILAHGTALSAAETARMIPQLSAPAIPSPAPGGGRISPPPT